MRGDPTPFDQHFVPPIDFKSGGNSPFAKVRHTFRAVYSLDARRRLRGMIAEFRPDVAHVRNIYHHLTPSILWEFVHKWLKTYRRCVDCFLAPSEFVKNKLVENGWDTEKIEVLPHFQTVPAELPSSANEHAPILYFGRLSPEKGVRDLLLAMQRLPRVLLQIAGDGPQRGELEELARQLQLGNVEFLGHLQGNDPQGNDLQGNDLQRAIRSARFTVLPSRAFETLGKTILESYSQGRAVVASDLGSRRELVREGVTGILFQPGNVASLAQAISRLVEHPQQAAAMGAAGWEMARDRHSPEAHYRALSRLYERLRKSKKPAGLQLVRPAPAKLRVAFIGGRGVISKYSGIETYYEEAGARLADLGYEVTIYCRNHFTPPLRQYRGMQLVRLPTIRSKHLETPVHTLLSTVHALCSRHDIVHYHALGPALFSFIPRLLGRKTAVTVQGLDWQRKKWGWLEAAVLRQGEQAAVRPPMEQTSWSRATLPAPPAFGCSRTNTFSFSAVSPRKRIAICSLRPIRSSKLP